MFWYAGGYDEGEIYLDEVSIFNSTVESWTIFGQMIDAGYARTLELVDLENYNNDCLLQKWKNDNDIDTLSCDVCFNFNIKQDGAASGSSSSREGIVRRFSCQDIRH